MHWPISYRFIYSLIRHWHSFFFCLFTLSTGLAFVSRDEKTGEEKWNGCSNIKLSVFENTYKFGDYVNSFNVQTNLWVLNYVYKRLKFLNNRSISHISALMFLAVWHGFHDGYYITFFLEFLIIHFEKEVVFLYLKSMRPETKMIEQNHTIFYRFFKFYFQWFWLQFSLWLCLQIIVDCTKDYH